MADFDTLFFDDWGVGSDLYTSSFLPDVPVTAATSDSSIWSSIGDALSKVSGWLDKNRPILEWGVPIVGGLASYYDARRRNKLIEEQMRRVEAEKAARLAEMKQLSAPRNYKLMRQKVEGPVTRRGEETLFFTNNALSANPYTQGYATGGAVQQHFDPQYYQNDMLDLAKGGLVYGTTPGQDDRIPAMLSAGEYVFDADTVSALGDGNNAAGASALERMRQNIRRHKRSAPANKIPPKAKSPEQYLKKARV